MEYIEVSIRDEYIRLGQAMKLAGILDSGSDIKYEILDGKVQVNGETEERRGRTKGRSPESERPDTASHPEKFR